jgi:hypothetical protein
VSGPSIGAWITLRRRLGPRLIIFSSACSAFSPSQTFSLTPCRFFLAPNVVRTYIPDMSNANKNEISTTAAAVDLAFEIQCLLDAAQDADDNDNDRLASSLRAKARKLAKAMA